MSLRLGTEGAARFSRDSNSDSWVEMLLYKVRLSSEDTRREVQRDALLQNRANCQELLDRKLFQLKLEPVMRLG